MKAFEEIWEIYLDSFLKNERRDFNKQNKIMENPLYKLSSIYDKNKLVGFTGAWDLHDFIFIEHLAAKKDCRGMGYGGLAVKKRRYC